MSLKAVLLLIILQSFHVIYGQSGGCEQLESNKCSSCLQIPGCLWCAQVDYTGSRCNTKDKLVLCNETVSGDPDKTPTLDELDLSETNQISPRKVSAKVRVGEPVKFQIEVAPAKNYPVDFYFLMDLSASMDDDLNIFKGLALNISAKLGELTTRHRLAFGSFVDKVVPPYVKKELVGKNYPGRLSTETYDKPYDFKHVLNFTADAKAFKDKIGEQVSSGNRDVPEGTFDALMQVAACENELRWNPANMTRRMVLIATDATFHIAGEGRFGGVINPNDRKCWLSRPAEKGARLYSKSLELDYPSVNQVYQQLKESSIQPIFAIGGDQAKDESIPYQAIVNTWDDISATLGKLDESSTNIIELIEESYNKITSTVRVSPASNPEGIDIKFESTCVNEKGVVTKGENECQNVKPGVKVTFDVSVTATSCKPGNKSTFSLTAAGFGSVLVELDVICKCDCENGGIPSSPTCNSNGTLVCGSCQCDEGRSGQNCQCDAQQFTDIDPNLCKESNVTGTPVCDGNGECDCGVCKCNLIAGRKEKYYGKFCQCSNFNCEESHGEICGGKGRGVCKCGKCDCMENYIESNCGNLNCSKFEHKCHTETEDGAQVNCNSHGFCDCGNCVCDTFYQGPYCDECPSCAGRCGDYKQCVLWKVFGVTPANVTGTDCSEEIIKLPTLAALKKQQFPTTCQETDDEGCTYYYSYVNKENKTTVYVVENKDCPEGPDVLLIVLAVIGGIVGIGIMLLILWKLLTAMVDRREYQKFEQDRAKSKWHREKNPLYQPATSTVQNPTFVGSKS